MGESEETKQTTSIDEKIAIYKAFVDILELARNTEEFFIDLDEEHGAFIIQGKINNFKFEYYTSKEAGGVLVSNDKYTVELETEGNLSQKVTRMIVQDREYTLDSVNGKNKKCDSCGEIIEETEKEPWSENSEEESIEEKLTNGKLPETKGMNGHEETTVKALHCGQILLKRIMKEIYTKAQGFVEITERYFAGKYLPERKIPNDFTTTEDIFKEFDLS